MNYGFLVHSSTVIHPASRDYVIGDAETGWYYGTVHPDRVDHGCWTWCSGATRCTDLRRLVESLRELSPIAIYVHDIGLLLGTECWRQLYDSGVIEMAPPVDETGRVMGVSQPVLTADVVILPWRIRGTCAGGWWINMERMLDAQTMYAPSTLVEDACVTAYAARRCGGEDYRKAIWPIRVGYRLARRIAELRMLGARGDHVTLAAMARSIPASDMGMTQYRHVRDRSDDMLWPRACMAGRLEVRYPGRHKTADDNLLLFTQPESGVAVSDDVNAVRTWDLADAYMSLAAAMRMPVRLLEATTDQDRIREALEREDRYVFAEVQLRDRYGIVPVHDGQCWRWPGGRHRTVLTHHELLAALQLCEDVEVLVGEIWHAARSEASWINALRRHVDSVPSVRADSMRRLARQVGIAKLGGLARQHDVWVTDTTMSPPLDWGDWRHVDEGTGTVTLYRSLAGRTWRRVRKQRANDSRPWAWAALTGLCRAIMAWAIDSYRHGRVLYVDTDGMIVHGPRVGPPRILPHWGLGIDELPVHERVVREVEIIGPRCYALDGQWTVSGIPEVATIDTSGFVVYRSRPRGAAVLCAGANSRPIVRSNVRTMGETWRWDGDLTRKYPIDAAYGWVE